MGFYIRKSVKAGPFRFNLSKSGLGVSAGVPGFRVGSGPRGNYVNVGAHGVYYRASLGSHRSPARPAQPRPFQQLRPAAPLAYRPQEVLMQDVSGSTSIALEPTGGDDVVDQLNSAAGRFGWGWPAVIASLALGALVMPWGLIVWTVAVPVCWWLFLRDAARRTVVLFYDVEDGASTWFEQLISVWTDLSSSQRVWRTVQSGQVSTVYQHKTNAGASSLVNRVTTVVSSIGPKHLATNVPVPTLTAGKSSLSFLPDRILVRDGKRYSDVGYDRLQVRARRARFIEAPGAVPTDSTQVGQTWQYVNVKGGPDRRFANNPVLPIVLYGEIDLQTPQGLDWRLQTSRAEAATGLSVSLESAPQHRQLGP